MQGTPLSEQEVKNIYCMCDMVTTLTWFGIFDST